MWSPLADTHCHVHTFPWMLNMQTKGLLKKRSFAPLCWFVLGTPQCFFSQNAIQLAIVLQKHNYCERRGWLALDLLFNKNKTPAQCFACLIKTDCHVRFFSCLRLSFGNNAAKIGRITCPQKWAYVGKGQTWWLRWFLHYNMKYLNPWPKAEVTTSIATSNRALTGSELNDLFFLGHNG